MDPYEFGVSKTLEFIQKHLPHSPSVKILEVGAGRGRLAARLREAGLEVDAIDKSGKAVEMAKESGVTVYEADILNYKSDKPYDCVVFCMSAHHVSPLGNALDRVGKLLQPGGMLILEEYATEDADKATTVWYEQTRALGISLDIFECDDEDPFANLGDPLAAWGKEHSSHGDHHFNTGAELISEISRRFEILDVSHGPYFYRYLAPRFSRKVLEKNLSENLLKLEEILIAAKQIRPLGLRIVATSKVSPTMAPSLAAT